MSTFGSSYGSKQEHCKSGKDRFNTSSILLDGELEIEVSSNRIHDLDLMVAPVLISTTQENAPCQSKSVSFLVALILGTQCGIGLNLKR